MPRKKKPEEHVNHERWMVSYADFITLLFAFFVMMYSISVVNTGKFKVLSESLTAAFQDPNRSLEPIQIGELVRSPADRPQENFAQNDPTRQRPVEIRQQAELASVEQEALRRTAERLDEIQARCQEAMTDTLAQGAQFLECLLAFGTPSDVRLDPLSFLLGELSVEVTRNHLGNALAVQHGAHRTLKLKVLHALSQLETCAMQFRHHCADGDRQHLGDFRVAQVVKIA